MVHLSLDRQARKLILALFLNKLNLILLMLWRAIEDYACIIQPLRCVPTGVFVKAQHLVNVQLIYNGVDSFV